MILHTKLLNYLQDLLVDDGKWSTEATYLDVAPVNRQPKQADTVYTASAGSNKQRLAAMRRHPSAQTGKRDK
jgi:hypothetical protein|tara:strand:- start:9347 stop:9562 length:216 start_codon:yes stop_codon:yes gene_type:complete